MGPCEELKADDPARPGPNGGASCEVVDGDVEPAGVNALAVRSSDIEDSSGVDTEQVQNVEIGGPGEQAEVEEDEDPEGQGKVGRQRRRELSGGYGHGGAGMASETWYGDDIGDTILHLGGTRYPTSIHQGHHRIHSRRITTPMAIFNPGPSNGATRQYARAMLAAADMPCLVHPKNIHIDSSARCPESASSVHT